MKLSAHYKREGWEVDFVKGIHPSPPIHLYDKSFISVIFSQNREKALEYAMMLPNCTVGGSGWDYSIKLDHDIEHILPDYSLYNLDYSLGFTSRGCIRNCGFCVVPEKEGFIHDHAPITEFLDPMHNKLILLDNNFGASPRWRENLEFLIENKIKVNFNQGIDIRLVTSEFADLLAETKYYNHRFKKRALYVAFDDMRYKNQFLKGMLTLRARGINPSHIMVYILVGYNTTFEQDLERVDLVKSLGSVPYIMRYNQVKTPELNKLARWVNGRYHEFIEWSKYK